MAHFTKMRAKVRKIMHIRKKKSRKLTFCMIFFLLKLFLTLLPCLPQLVAIQ